MHNAQYFQKQVKKYKNISFYQIIYVILQYNYKFNNIYGLSPYLLSDDNVIIEDQDNSEVMNLIYNELSKINKPKILIKTEYGVDLCTKFLENYVDSKYTSGSYNLFVDVEYSKRIIRWWKKLLISGLI